ncbi:hypothetical protein [Reichenbachiella sp.]|uniref:hypothetical protein n=1 Tax=Reichenbachiella sp. TaxID=2184521 RepID=UPI003BB0049C
MNQLNWGGQRYVMFGLVCLWATIQYIAYKKFGILYSVDSELYLLDAQSILRGEFPSGRSIMYVSYSMLLAVVQGVELNIVWIVTLQLAASLLAMVAIFRLASSLFKSDHAGSCAALLYVLWVKVHQWNFIIYTDSLFTSFSIISFVLFYFSTSKKNYFLASIVFLFAVFIRPNGIGLFIAMIGFLITKLPKGLNEVSRKSVLFGTSIALLLLINQLLEPHVGSFINSYAQAEIIYPNRRLFFLPPETLYTPDQRLPALMQLIQFAFYNPIYFAKLFSLKSILFLANIKPYFSWIHNMVIVLYLYPIYYFSFLGIRQIKDKGIIVFVSFFIGLQTLVVGLTSENWDGRFVLPVLPLVFVLASGPISQKLKMFFHE